MVGSERCGRRKIPLMYQQKTRRSSAKAPDATDKGKGHKGSWHLASLRWSAQPTRIRSLRSLTHRCAPDLMRSLRSLPHQRCASLGCPWNHRWREWFQPPVTAVAAPGQRRLRLASQASLRQAERQCHCLAAPCYRRQPVGGHLSPFTACLCAPPYLCSERNPPIGHTSAWRITQKARSVCEPENAHTGAQESGGDNGGRA